MLALVWDGQYLLVAALLAALVLSLTCHEFGHAFVAKLCGDNTAERAGRLTLNPVPHIDPVGLLMVVAIGFGYAKPVPTDPRNFRWRSAELWVAAAGPGMNLLLAALAWNLFALLLRGGVDFAATDGAQTFFLLLVQINLLLMLFNLIPLGPLDGHYILPFLLPRNAALAYRRYNARYGAWLLLGLIAMQFLGVPVFATLMGVAQAMLPWIDYAGLLDAY